MSLYENTSKKILFHNLKSRYDFENVTSSQWSLFCYHVLNKLRHNNWIIDDNIKSMYEDAIIEVSSKFKEIEDAKIISNEYNFQITGNFVSYLGKVDNTSQNKDNIKPLSNLFFEVTRILSEKKFMIINRFDQSFLVFPDIKNHTLKIFDSHQKCFGDFTNDGVIKYILGNGNSSRITWLTGRIDYCENNHSNNKYKISFLYDEGYYAIINYKNTDFKINYNFDSKGNIIFSQDIDEELKSYLLNNNYLVVKYNVINELKNLFDKTVNNKKFLPGNLKTIKKDFSNKISSYISGIITHDEIIDYISLLDINF